jgi:alpha-D-ribose 1-methylphosphonate 5-triphosphate synthase subunit PhnG
LTGKSVRKMKETYSTEDYTTVPGYDVLTTENQEAARVAFNKALAQQEIMDSVKSQAEAEKAEKAAMRKRKNARREMDISQVDWLQLLRTGELQHESLNFLKQLCKVSERDGACVFAFTSRRHKT